MRVDPTFTPDRLSAEERLWYDRLLESMAASAGTVELRAASGDLYLMGRYVGDYTAALLTALRATGDRQFLDRVAAISDIYRTRLADAWLDGTTDGFVNWLWLADSSSSDYGKDLHQMDEAMTHGNVGLVAYAFDQNRDVDPAYASRAEFWTGYLENQFLAKWILRSGGDSVAAWETGFYKRFTHPRANQLRLAYYLWRITGKPFYLDRADAIAAELLAHVETNPDAPDAYRWKQQLQGADEGWQKINYAEYFMGVVMEMGLEGFSGYASDAEMGHYASTFSDVVFEPFPPGYSEMLLRVYGPDTTGAACYGLAGFARWDPTGRLLDVAERDYSPGSAGVSVAAYALMAVSRRADVEASTGPSTPAPAAANFCARPNPFNVETELSFQVPRAARVRIEIFDVRGRRVRTLLDGTVGVGRRAVTWDRTTDSGERAAAGVYCVRIVGAAAPVSRELLVVD